MSTTVTPTSNPLVEYHGIAHIQSMTRDSSDCDKEIVEKPAEQIVVEQKQKLGRPVSLTEAYKYILARDGALAYAEVIARDAREAKNARDRLSAAQEMEDRVTGKAVQSHRVEQGLDDNTAKCLLVLAEKLAPKIAILQPQQVVVSGGTVSEGIMLSAAGVDNKEVR